MHAVMRTISATVFLASVASVAFVAWRRPKPKAPDPILAGRPIDSEVGESRHRKGDDPPRGRESRDDRIKILKIDYALDTGPSQVCSAIDREWWDPRRGQRAELEFDVRVPLPEDSELFARSSWKREHSR